MHDLDRLPSSGSSSSRHASMDLMDGAMQLDRSLSHLHLELSLPSRNPAVEARLTKRAQAGMHPLTRRVQSCLDISSSSSIASSSSFFCSKEPHAAAATAIAAAKVTRKATAIAIPPWLHRPRLFVAPHKKTLSLSPLAASSHDDSATRCDCFQSCTTNEFSILCQREARALEEAPHLPWQWIPHAGWASSRTLLSSSPQPSRPRHFCSSSNGRCDRNGQTCC